MPASTMDEMTTTAAADTKPGFTPAVDLRIAFNRLLGEHMQIAVDATQTALLGGKSFDAKGAELQANTDDLAAAIGSLYGDAAKQAFANQWNAHNGYFVNYTVATAKDDAAGKQKAVDGLTAYTKNSARFLAGATGLPADAVTAQLAMHVMHTAEGRRHVRHQGLRRLVRQRRDGLRPHGRHGRHPGRAPSPSRSRSATTSDAADLRVKLDDLLAEHAALAIVAMERGLRRLARLQVGRRHELDKNTVALGDMIGSRLR